MRFASARPAASTPADSDSAGSTPQAASARPATTSPPRRATEPMPPARRPRHHTSPHATRPQPPTIGCSAVAAPSTNTAAANLARPISPIAARTSAHANTFASQPPITHSPAAVVCSSASANSAAASSLPNAVGRSGTTAWRKPLAKASQPSQRPTQAPDSSPHAARIGPITA